MDEHNSVWGSWYDAKTSRWGYACCRLMERGVACSAPRLPEANFPEDEGQSDSGIEKTSSDSEVRAKQRTERSPLNWSDSPETLLPREEVIATVPNDISERLRPRAEKAAWVEHFIRLIVGAWQRKLSSGLEAITPLVWRLRHGVNLNHGEGSLLPSAGRPGQAWRESM